MRRGTVAFDGDADVLDRQLERIGGLVDDRLGIIANVLEIFREPDDPYIFNFTTVLSNVERYTGCGKPPGLNGGAGLTRTRALLGAIGETIERYACSSFDTAGMLYGSHRELTAQGHRCFDPERIGLFSERQYRSEGFRFRPFSRTTPALWERCECLSDRPPRPIYFPAGLIYMPPSALDQARGDVEVCPVISTGQASGTTIEMASLSGLMEVIERDAYTIAWHNRLRSPKLEHTSSPIVSRLLRERFAPCPVEILLNYVTLDLDVPVVVATGVDRMNPSISCILGVAAHLDPEIAAVKALIELAQDRFYVKYLARSFKLVDPSETFSEIDDFEKRVVLYLNPKMIPALDFWREEPSRTLRFDEIPNASGVDDRESLGIAVDRVRAVGGTVIRKDCTTADLRELGLHVVKIQVPELEALEGNHNWRFFGCERLYRVPVEMGYRSTPLDESEMNPHPHPLP